MFSIFRKDIDKGVLVLAGIGIFGHIVGIVGPLCFDRVWFGLPIWNHTGKTLVEFGGLLVTVILIVGVIRKSQILCYLYIVYIIPYLSLLVIFTAYLGHIFHCYKIPFKLSLPTLIPTFFSAVIITIILSGVIVFVKKLKPESLQNQRNLQKTQERKSSIVIQMDQKLDNVDKSTFVV